VQRLFSTFPGGWPGLGLLLLRTAVAIAAVAQAIQFMTTAAWTWVVAAASLLAGASLGAGFLTPGAGTASALAVIVMAALPWRPPDTALPVDRAAAAFLIVDAVALILLGPGAFSVDARLFGRRVIVISRDENRVHTTSEE